MIDQTTKDQLRWQSSPLRRAIDDVVAAVTKAQGYQVGANRATNRIVTAAKHLRDIREDIDLGDRDGLGYPIDTGEAS